jgi:hypothetical protein
MRRRRRTTGAGPQRIIFLPNSFKTYEMSLIWFARNESVFHVSGASERPLTIANNFDC